MLRIRIDNTRKVAHFSGPSTYHAKEAIKRLGNARFLGEEKAWEVSAFSQAPEDLYVLFSEFKVEIEVSGESSVSEKTIEAPRTAGAAADIPNGLSVPQLIAKVKGALDAAFSGGALVYGVITAIKSSNGRTFITLSDTAERSTSVSCVVWSGIDQIEKPLQPYGLKLEADLEVMFHTGVGLNSKNGNLSLRINRIVPEYTIAKLLGERDKTNKRLKEEGIFERNKQLALPALIVRVGVLTSSGGTVIHDFSSALEAAAFAFQIFWVPVPVQGSEAKASILKGLEVFSARTDLDAILLFRGGGSAADLSVFNQYEIARAICLAPVPVLSAIGHQEDQCSAQDVSHTAFGVPRDIGNFLAERILRLRDQLQRFSERILAGGETVLERGSVELRRAADNLLQRSVRAIERSAEKISTLVGRLDIQGVRAYERALERVTRLSGTLKQSSAQVVGRAEERLGAVSTIPRSAALLLERKAAELERIGAHVSDAAPEVQLKRGFSIVKSNGKFVRTAASLKAGDEVGLQFVDGSREAKIIEGAGKDGRAKG